MTSVGGVCCVSSDILYIMYDLKCKVEIRHLECAKYFLNTSFQTSDQKSDPKLPMLIESNDFFFNKKKKSESKLERN